MILLQRDLALAETHLGLSVVVATGCTVFDTDKLVISGPGYILHRIDQSTTVMRLRRAKVRPLFWEWTRRGSPCAWRPGSRRHVLLGTWRLQAAIPSLSLTFVAV